MKIFRLAAAPLAILLLFWAGIPSYFQTEKKPVPHPGTWVATTTGGSLIASTDNWASSSEVLRFGARFFSALSYGNGVFVATGSNGFHYTSPDGKIWEPGNHSHFEDADYKVLSYGNKCFVTFPGGGTKGMYTQNNGINWLQTTSPNGVAALTYGNGRFVGISQSKGAIYSTDNGVTWKSASVSQNDNHIYLNCISFGNGKFWAAGMQYQPELKGVVFSSPDGVTWTNENYPFEHQVNDIYYHEQRKRILVACDKGFVGYREETGTTWSGVNTPSPVALNNFVLGPDNQIFVNGLPQHGPLFHSLSDGASWVTYPEHIPGVVKDVIFVPGIVIKDLPKIKPIIKP